MRVLGLVPARAGSQGVPWKNLRELAGKPLLGWTAEAALMSGVIDRVLLTTEDERLAAIGRQVGMDVPFMRPPALARDDTPMIDVVLHALRALEDIEGFEPEAVALLQPTSPLRQPRHIRAATALLEGGDSVCTVTPVPKELCPHYVMRIDEAGRLDHFLPEGARFTRRQDVPQAYSRDGTIYLARTALIKEEGTLYGERCIPLVLSADESLSIDSPADWDEAERRLLRRRLSDRPSGVADA